MTGNNHATQPGGRGCSSGHTREQHMRMFDMLPAPIRQRVSQCKEDYCPIEVYMNWKNCETQGWKPTEFVNVMNKRNL